MRVLVYGAGQIGGRVIRQLQKNPAIEIVTVDPRDEPWAITQGIIESIDLSEVLNPVTLEEIVEAAKPDLILLATASEDLALGNAPGIDILADALREEVSALSEVPVIEVARTT